MPTYHYLTLTLGTMIVCTDPATLDWIVAQVRNHIPTADIRNELFDGLSGERYQLQLHKLNNKDFDVNVFLRRILPKAGWRLVSAFGGESTVGYIGANDTLKGGPNHTYLFEREG